MSFRSDSRPSRRRALISLTALAAASGVAPAWAQAWPAKPIKLVLPSGAGGGSDIFGRVLAEYMSRELKTQVVVENRPGANGIVALEAVFRQPPDGYALVMSYTAATIGNKLLMPKMPLDPLTDLQPIGRIGGGGGNLLIANPDLPVRTIKEMTAWVKAQGTEVSYASWGIASGGHLVMEMMKHRLGLKLNHVPYKTVAQIPPDIISGVVPFAWIDTATPMPSIRSGRLRAIACSSAKRPPQLPDCATLEEQGVPYDAPPSYGLYGPVGMPQEIVLRLNTVLNRWLLLPDTVAFFEQKQNAPAPIPLTPDEFAQEQQRDLVRWKKLIVDSKVVL